MTLPKLREVGRAVRTIVLLRYLSEPELREGITAVTNRVEAFHGLAAAGVLIDPEDLATVTPNITSRIRRFGDWKLDLTPPAAVPAALDLEIGV